MHDIKFRGQHEKDVKSCFQDNKKEKESIGIGGRVCTKGLKLSLSATQNFLSCKHKILQAPDVP